MFVKWPKTYRILVPQVDVKGKHFLSDKDVKRLLGGHVAISEKVDGANCGIIRTKKGFRLQKRGSLVGQSEHEQFNRLISWSYENYDRLMQIPKNHILYGEWCYCKHTIYYDSLPDYFLGFGLYGVRAKQFLCHRDMEKLCDKIELNHVAPIASGHGFKRDELFDLIPNQSAYGQEKAEGIVVYNFKQQLRGKIVRAEFQKSMDRSGHWMHQKITYNKVKINDE